MRERYLGRLKQAIGGVYVATDKGDATAMSEVDSVRETVSASPAFERQSV